MEIELTANKADVLLSWVIDTFEKEDGRTMLELKDMLLSNNQIKITREEYDAAFF